MTCPDARELCSALVDDALAPDERAALDAHLAGCAECRRELERLRQTVSALRAVRPVRAPAGFVDRVVEAARPTPWHRELARRLFRPLSVKLPLGAAAVVLVGVAAVSVFQHTPELQQAARHEAPARQEAPRSLSDAARPPATAPAVPPVGVPGAPSKEAPATAPGAERDVVTGPQRATEIFQTAPAPEPAPKPAIPAPPPSGEATKSTAPAPSAGAPARPTAKRSSDAATFGGKSEPASVRSQAEEKGQAPTSAVTAPASPPAAPPLAESRAAMKSAPAGEGRVAGVRERRDEGVAPGAQPEPSAQVRAADLRPADVVGRLTVGDRAAAERALAELIARVGGVELSRRAEADATLVEVAVPREAYAEFSRGLARIGRWRVEREATEIPARVVVTLRISS